MEKPVILNTSDEAATYKTDIAGWVSRTGHFFGKDERTARWDGCTHIACEKCGEIRSRNSYCHPCHERGMAERYARRERRKWDGVGLLYSETADKYFNDSDDLEDYCADNECQPESLRLVICEPVYAKEIDPNEYYCDDLPEDGEVDGDLAAAFEELNRVIKESKPILSWMPGKYAADL